MANPNPDDDQLYDMLNLSPPSTMNKYASQSSDFHPSTQSPNNFPMQSPNSNFLSDQTPNSNFLSDQTPNSIFDFTGPTNEINDFLYDNNGNTNQQNINDYQKDAHTNGLSLTISNLYEATTNDLLTPGNFNSNFLHPKSPGTVSNHSLYSDASSNPGSPFIDALSQFSNNHAYSDVGNNPVGNNLLSVGHQASSFDTEIGLGGSISSTNLMGLHSNQNPPPQFNISVTDDTSVPPYNSSVINSQLNNELDKLTQNNLNTYTNHMQQPQRNQDVNQNFSTQSLQQPQPLSQHNLLSNNYINEYSANGDITINIDRVAEEIVAARTPSLFSNSSHNSSVENSPRRSPNHHRGSGNLSPGFHNNNGSNLLINQQIPPSSPGSVLSDVSDNQQNLLLRPEEYQSIRRGRKYAHSHKVKLRSRLRSSAKSEDYSDDDGISSGYDDDDDNKPDDKNGPGLSTREKMLELASPNQSSKRTQKHPSVYACHLCEKRFTRPYNLKSHLRTHTDERPFICNVCGKAFARQHDRKRHEDLHTGEKKFQCKGLLKDGTPYGCGRKFARADALRRHFQTEAGKECIRLLVEEDEKEKIKNGTFKPGDYDISNIGMAGVTGEKKGSSDADATKEDFLSPNSAYLNGPIPQVAISPPE